MPPMELPAELPAEILDLIKASPHSSRAQSRSESESESSDESDSDDSPAAGSGTEQAADPAANTHAGDHPSSGAPAAESEGPKELGSIRVTSDVVSDAAKPHGEITVAAVLEVLTELGGKGRNHNVTALLELPVFRSAQLAPVWAGRRIIWERAENVEAILIQCVGVEAPSPCHRCSDNLGPFEGCYTVPGMISYCGNCKYNSQAHRCSNHPKNSGMSYSHATRRRPKRSSSTDGHPLRKRRTHNPSPMAIGGASMTASVSTSNMRFAPPAATVAAVVPSAPSGGDSAARMLQVPVPPSFGWEDAMTLRRVLHEISEQFIYQQQDTRQIRKLLRDLSGTLEDYASEMQD